MRDRARRTTSPSETNKAPIAASHNRIAFSSIASNTGARLPGERVDDFQHLRQGGFPCQRRVALGTIFVELLLQTCVGAL